MRKVEYPENAWSSFLSHYELGRPIFWEQAFGRRAPLVVEIGCGLGEFLVRTARTERNHNFVGIEQDWKRVKKTLRKIEFFYCKNQMPPFNNIRVIQTDAAVAFERLFVPLSLNKIFCLFPCPWPKQKHSKYRLFSRDFLKLLNSRLMMQGEVQIVTDHEPYCDWIIGELSSTGFDYQKQIVQPRFETKFERKWTQAGQKEFFQLSLVKAEHQDVAVTKDVELKTYRVEEFDPDHFHLDEIAEDIVVVPKEFLYDVQRKKGMARLLVSEKGLTQQVWISIEKVVRGWLIAKTEGHTVLPTSGVARALHHVYQAAKCASDSATQKS